MIRKKHISFVLFYSLITWVTLLLLLSTNAIADTIHISETIVVGEGETYDGGGDTIVASGMGDGSQDESQDPIFKLQKGATLKNVIIAAPGCDGVHCYGNNTVENVVWEDVGEDALTVKDGDSASSNTVTVSGGSAYYADDKVFQLNAPVTFTVKNFTAQDMGKLIRQNGDTTFECQIYLYNVTVNGADECVARTDSSSTQLYYDNNCSFSNVGELWIFPSDSQIHQIDGDSSVDPDSDSDSDVVPDSSGDTDVETGVNYRIINRNSNKLLEVENADTSDGANVVQWTNNGHACQQWQFEDTGDGYYLIRNANSGKLLEVSYADTSDSANVAQWSDTEHICQQWSLQSTGDGYYIFINRNSGSALDVLEWSSDDGANIIQWPNHGGKNQQWKLSK
ncbi:MAG: RICIN domain-containing protein [Desulfobacteraceae bacterium]|jgi:hypothetical protein